MHSTRPKFPHTKTNKNKWLHRSSLSLPGTLMKKQTKIKSSFHLNTKQWSIITSCWCHRTIIIIWWHHPQTIKNIIHLPSTTSYHFPPQRGDPVAARPSISPLLNIITQMIITRYPQAHWLSYSKVPLSINRKHQSKPSTSCELWVIRPKTPQHLQIKGKTWTPSICEQAYHKRAKFLLNKTLITSWWIKIEAETSRTARNNSL